jgi:hypothetical protein
MLITADADMWSLKLWQHVGDDPSQIFIFNNRALGLQQRPGEPRKYRQYPLNTIAMTAKLWREVMGE